MDSSYGRTCFCKLVSIAKTSTEVISIDMLCKARATTTRLFNAVAHSKLTSSSWTTFTSCTPKPPRFILLQRIFSFILTSTREQLVAGDSQCIWMQNSIRQENNNNFDDSCSFWTKTGATGENKSCRALTASYLDRCPRDGFYACGDKLSSL